MVRFSVIQNRWKGNPKLNRCWTFGFRKIPGLDSWRDSRSRLHLVAPTLVIPDQRSYRYWCTLSRGCLEQIHAGTFRRNGIDDVDVRVLSPIGFINRIGLRYPCNLHLHSSFHLRSILDQNKDGPPCCPFPWVLWKYPFNTLFSFFPEPWNNVSRLFRAVFLFHDLQRVYSFSHSWKPVVWLTSVSLGKHLSEGRRFTPGRPRHVGSLTLLSDLCWSSFTSRPRAFGVSEIPPVPDRETIRSVPRGKNRALNKGV